ncbi:hypothetical protein HH303_03525 [Rhodospirillaceae bacterium KN72]|uniref:Suppressor for copper-sensitivity B n=1 Tax=Pacificispira spongiicola TaxID=2729598 RepID=A0A7Y0DXZ9_9PROT|nr:protein-disulfide reductase DsbD domain-containing protein [Pacificispira spongiicola]NMM43533.1 hypothetical protein [Pacificispira spongiicola]
MARLISLALALIVPLGLVLTAPPSAGIAQANSGDWQQSTGTAVRLISASSAVASGDDGTAPAATVDFGLEFRMEPGWKIYWRTPGDAGLPPEADWSKSDNVASVAMQWPVPERFEIFDIGTLGYEGAVVFPLTVALNNPGAPTTLAGTVDFLICSEICVPGTADIDLTLPAGQAGVSPEAHLLDQYRARVPTSDTIGSDLSVDRAVVTALADGAAQVAVAVSAEMLNNPDLFVEGPGGAYFDVPTISPSGDGKSAILSVHAPGNLTAERIASEGVTVTFVDGNRAIERFLHPEIGEFPISMAAEPISDGHSLWLILGLALLGGLILNLMPCVLPVLSLKLLSVISKSGKDRRDVRIGFLASSAGILASFMLLAGAAIGLKLAGLGVGWGIQFQQPVFLAFMVALLTLFASNLLGLFEFRLPGWVGDRAGRDSAHHGHFGDFLSGAFATLLATPCSAPFLGTAVGFALASGPLEIAAVFLALGIGLALPYLIVAVFPGLVRLLPRPGAWMIRLRWILALALIGTAVWLLSILAVSLGVENAAGIGALAALAIAVLASRKLDGSRIGRFAWPLSAALSAVLVVSPLLMTPVGRSSDSLGSRTGADQVWQTFDPARIPSLVADGKTVLVDVTADWCVTCQWNKKTVLDSQSVTRWLSDPSVVAMRADWTRPDPKISDFLARYNRFGIPFNIVYGPDAPQGVTLPELLSEDAMADAIKAADSDTRFAALQ